MKIFLQKITKSELAGAFLLSHVVKMFAALSYNTILFNIPSSLLSSSELKLMFHRGPF